MFTLVYIFSNRDIGHLLDSPKKEKEKLEPFFVWKKILFDLKTMTLSSLLEACLKAAFWFFGLLGCDVHMVPSFSQKTEKKSEMVQILNN